MLAAIGVCACVVVSDVRVPAAGAEEVFTSQAAAAHATDSTWIPAPEVPAAVCIVDTGNTPNPDTTNVIARLAIDNGDPGDVDTVGHHGTLMSMIASAPYNGFGMVGAAPSVKVVSVRAMRPGQGGFFFSDVLAGIQMCTTYRTTYNIKVIALSLGAQGTLDPATEAALQSKVDAARFAKLDVVAAAGNHAGQVEYPAAYPSVLAIGAAADSGERCPFASFGKVDLWAPGCPQDVALNDGRPGSVAGSSESAVFVAAVLAQLRGLRPDLSPAAAETALLTTASAGGAGPMVNAMNAFLSEDLATELLLGRMATPSSLRSEMPAGPTQPVLLQHAAIDDMARESSSPATTHHPRLPLPRIKRCRFRRHRLTLALANRPPHASAIVQVYMTRRGHPFATSLLHRLASAVALDMKLSGTPTQVFVSYLPRVHGQFRSSSRTFVHCAPALH